MSAENPLQGLVIKDSTSQAAAKRLRKGALKRGNEQRAQVEARHPFRNEPAAAGPAPQQGAYK